MDRLKRAVLARLPWQLIELVSRAKSRTRRRLALRRHGPLIARLFPRSRSYRVLVAFDDSSVFRIKTGAGAETILKIASTAKAEARIETEMHALVELTALEVLGDWRSCISAVQDRGTHDHGTWFTQSALPGVSTLRLDTEPDLLVTAAAAALLPLHRMTSTSVLADDALLDRLVSARTATVARWRPDSSTEVARLDSSLRSRLAGRQLNLSRLHGDYAPSNVLWDAAAREVTGIVDWTFGNESLPPEVDLVHFALALLAERGHFEYGGIVIRSLDESASVEAETVRAALDAGPNDFDLDLGVTLAWLQHTSFTLSKAEDLRNNTVWLVNNVDQVIARLTAG